MNIAILISIGFIGVFVGVLGFVNRKKIYIPVLIMVTLGYILFTCWYFGAFKPRWEVMGHFTDNNGYYGLYLKNKDDIIMVGVNLEQYKKYQKGDKIIYDK